jgi:hypothetical protein
MGYNILYTKNTKLCIKKKRHQAIQVPKEAAGDVYAKMRTPTLESVVMVLYGHKE